jgi:glutamate synthase (NADPH) small chain
MGKPDGFLKYPRSLPVLRDPAERVSRWDEFHLSLDENELRRQAARCMNCGTPFCHFGSAIEGITTGCPIHNLIPDWNDLVYQGKWHEAYELLSSTNNFPEFTGRICPAPCENSCILGINADPVVIKEIEVSIIDHAFNEGWVISESPQIRSGKKIAVIGSGPAGLACGDELNKRGHNVTVLEREDRIGGLLVYGIPSMKLDKVVVERRVELMAAAGIEFRTNVSVGEDISAQELRREFDAIVLCCGATQPRDLQIEGRDLREIHFAMELLTENTKRLLSDDIPDSDICNLKDKKVLVIGGGDTGTDCVATAIRLGCNSLVQFEIMPQPPAKTIDHDSWLARVRTFQTDYGQEEATAIFGSDPREYSVLTKRFVGDEKGNLLGVETVNAEYKNGSFEERPGTERLCPADVVFLALGFAGVEKNMLLNDLGVRISDRNTIEVDENKQTAVPGIFAAGDCERGQSLVVWAIADGRTAAAGVNRYLTKISSQQQISVTA